MGVSTLWLLNICLGCIMAVFRLPVWLTRVTHNLFRTWVPRKSIPRPARFYQPMRPGRNGRHSADDLFQYIFLNEYIRISIKISLKFVSKPPINNIPSMIQIQAWHRPGDKPFYEPMMVRLPTHMCVIRPRSVKKDVAHAKCAWYSLWYLNLR